MKKVSLKDIAQALNLSKATVSWILSEQGKAKGFSEATIKRVKDYADSVNYRPNLLARSLSLGTTNTIGLIIPFIGDTFYAQLVQAIEYEAIRNKYVLIVCSSEGDPVKELELVKMLRSKQVDGIIIAPTNVKGESFVPLMKESFPFVLIDRYYPSFDMNYVIVNNYQACKDLTTCLIEKGSRKIAMVTVDAHLLVMQLRQKGFYEAAENAGLEEQAGLAVEVDRANLQEDLAKGLENLLEKEPAVDGFLFNTHFLALETIRYFVTHQIDYRKRFNMGCFHYTTALDILAPEMSLSRMPIEQIGIKALQLLLKNIQDPQCSSEGIVLENQLIK